jgi:hypothetical protein
MPSGSNRTKPIRISPNTVGYGDDSSVMIFDLPRMKSALEPLHNVGSATAPTTRSAHPGVT